MASDNRFESMAAKPSRRTVLAGATASVVATGVTGNLPAAHAAGAWGVRGPSDATWTSFLNAQAMVWKSVPGDFYVAPFLGNGGLGASLYKVSSTSKKVKLEIGHNDVRDHQTDAAAGGTLWGRARLQVGSLNFNTVGDVTDVDLRIDLKTAQLTGTITTTAGTVQLTTYVLATSDVLVVTFKPSAGEAKANWTFIPKKALSTRVGWAELPTGLKANPEPVVTGNATAGSCDQKLTVGGGHATVWQSEPGSNGWTRLYLGVVARYPESDALSKATALVRDTRAKGLPALVAAHEKWWREYYAKSFVSFPDSRLQSFYWIQLYKVACVTRADRPLITTMGPWLEKTPWPAAWWNLNVQLSYWLINASGHPELDSLTHALDIGRDALKANVDPKYRADSYGIARSSQTDLFSATAPIPGATDSLAQASVGNLVWALHNSYLTYRHTMDDASLRNVIYPVLRGAINYYLHFLTTDASGRLHLPKTFSPEYAFATDCNYDLALLHWGVQTLLSATDRLKIDDPLRPKWKNVLEKLVDPPQDDTQGFWIGSDRKLTSSHRHYSHLLWFYPLYQFDVTTDAKARAALQKSLAHWQSMTGALQGYSFTGAASMSAMLGAGDDAVTYLSTLLNKYVKKNTMYAEYGPVLETPLSGAQSLHDLLVQSWGDTVRVLPAVPKAWKDVAIHDIRTEGGFRVSVQRRGGVTQFVRVRSDAGEPLRLQHSFSGKVQVNSLSSPGSKVTWTTAANGIIEVTLAKGAEIIVTPEGTAPTTYQVGPVATVNTGAQWGLPT